MTTVAASAKTETLFNRLVDRHARTQGANKLDNNHSKPQTMARTNFKSNTVKENENDSLKEILVNIDKALNTNLTFESPPIQSQANRFTPPSMNLDSSRSENGESSSPAVDHNTQAMANKIWPNYFNEVTEISKLNRLQRDYERLHHENTVLKKRVAMLEDDKQYLCDLVGSLRLEKQKRNEADRTKKIDGKNARDRHRDSLTLAVDVALPIPTKPSPEVNGEEKETLRRKSSLLKERDQLLGKFRQKMGKETLTEQVIVEEKGEIKHSNKLHVNTSNQTSEVEVGDQTHEYQLRKVAAAPVSTAGKKKFQVDRARSRRATFGAVAQEAGLFG